MRLDRFLVEQLAGLSRSRVQALIRTGRVVGPDGTILNPGTRVKPGDQFMIDIPPPEPARPAPQRIALAVVFEDPHLIVVDKPAGLVVHPSAGHADGTLVNALIAHCGDSLSGVGGQRRPGIVHRLDKDTSGLLVAAKTDAAHQGLAQQFASHGADGRLLREYLALVWGAPSALDSPIDVALTRSRSNRTKIATSQPGAGGRHAVTHFQVLQPFTDAEGKVIASLMACRLETGRTHQIRVHLAHIGHPLLGDQTYGAHFASRSRALPPSAAIALQRLGRQALHGAKLGFEHPISGRRQVFTSPPPKDMARLIDALTA